MTLTRIVRSVERRVDLVRVDPTVAVHRQLDDLEAELLEVAQAVADRVMLDRARHDPVATRLAGPGRPLQGEVVGLGPAGGEDDLARPRRRAATRAARGPRRGTARARRPRRGPTTGCRTALARGSGTIASTTSRRTGGRGGVIEVDRPSRPIVRRAGVRIRRAAAISRAPRRCPRSDGGRPRDRRAAARARTASRLRRRIEVGVTSTSSSTEMNSMADSRVIGRAGVSRSDSSWAWVRMLVSFFVLRRVDVHVARARVLADDHPLVDVDAGADEQLARSWRLNRP